MKNLRYMFSSQETLDKGLMMAITSYETQKGRQRVKQLLASGAHPETPAIIGRTPLITAAALNRREIVEMLLAHGADPTYEQCGETAALRAFQRGYVPLSERLIRAEIEWNKKHGKPAVSVSEQKIKAFAAARAADPKSEQREWEKLFWDAIVEEDVAFIKGVFSEKIFNQNTQWREFPIDPLVTAIRNNYQKSITALMEAGWNTTISLQRYPELVAETSLLKALLELGADPLAKNEKGKTSIENAERYGHHASVAMMELHLQKQKEAAQDARIKALEEEIRAVRQQLTEKQGTGKKRVRKFAPKSRTPGK